MTNREWLESLSDHELADLLANFSERFPYATKGWSDSGYGVEQWLKGKHEKEEKE